jgi:antitoxin ParD1/3/4
MDLNLTSEQEALIHRKVASGSYVSADEVIGEALRLLDERDRLQEWRLEELRKDVAAGIKEADEGKLGPLDAQATLQRIRARKSSGVV